MSIIIAVVFMVVTFGIMIFGLYVSKYKKRDSDCCSNMGCYEEKSYFLECKNKENNKS